MRKLLLLFLCSIGTVLWAQQPKLVLPVGHINAIYGFYFSHDGRYIVTTGDEGSKVWNAFSGHLLADFDGYVDGERTIPFSPDGKYIITRKDSTAKVWNLYNGELVLHLKGHSKGVNSASFSTDGKFIVTCSDDRTAKIWNAVSGELIADLLGNGSSILNAFFFHDGKSIITQAFDKTTKIWDVATAKLLRQLKGNTDTNFKIALFSANAQYLVTLSKNKVVQIWHAESGVLLRDLAKDIINVLISTTGKYVITYGQNTVKVWNTVDGTLITNFKGKFYKFTVSPDDKYLMTQGLTSYDTVKIWNLNDGQLVSKLQGEAGAGWKSAFSPGSKYIVTSTTGGSTKVWNTLTGQPVTDLKGHTSNIQCVLFSPAKEYILTAHDDAICRVWNTNNAEIASTLKGHTSSIIDASFSPDGKYIVTASWDNTAKVWSALSGELVKDLIGHKDYLTRAFFSPDGKLIATVSVDTTVKLWSAMTGDLVLQISKFAKPVIKSFFSPDNKYLLTQEKDKDSIKVWNAASGLLVAEMECIKTDKSASFSPDGKFLVVVSYDGVKVWNVLRWEVIIERDSPIGIGVYTAEFSPDGKKIILASDNNTIEIWDAITGKVITKLKEPKDEVVNASFSPDGKYIISTGSYSNNVMVWNYIKDKFAKPLIIPTQAEFKDVDFKQKRILTQKRSEVEVFDLETGKSLYTFFALDSFDYFKKTSSGFYQSSPNASKLLHYVTKDLKVISFEQLDVKYNRPDKVLEVIGSTDIALIRSYRKAYEKRLKKLGIDTTAFSDDYSVPEADFANRDKIDFDQNEGKLRLDIQTVDSNYKLDRFNIWVNETPLYGQRGISLRYKNTNSFDSTITIPLSQGQNKIETSITNVNGTESYRMPLLVNYTPPDSQKVKTYFIGIGIDQFNDSKYNLKYSTKDISDLGSQLKKKYKDIFIDTLFNENVTISNVKALKQKLLQTSVNDKVIISYSGHGMLSKDFDYYLSTYAVNFDKPEENGLPYDELENLLDSIPARKKLMLIDACHSGEVDKDDLVALNATDKKLIKGLKPVAYKKDGQLGLKNSFELMQSLFVNVGKSTGATIISAAAGTEFALEGIDNLPNGVFTYCILEAMNKYPTMKISELKKIVSERVVEITGGLQKPTSRNETIAVDWEIWQTH